MERSVANHSEDCHRSPKIFPGSLSKLGTTSLFHREIPQSLHRRGGRAGGGEGRNPGAASPSAKLASTSCESAARGPDRRTTPSLSTRSVAQDAAVVPPETPAGARRGCVPTRCSGPCGGEERSSEVRKHLPPAETWQLQQSLPPSQWRRSPAKSDTPFSTSASGALLGEAVGIQGGGKKPRTVPAPETPPSRLSSCTALSKVIGRAFPLIHSEESRLGKECQVQKGILRG